jgi:hypothetical protein
MKTLKYMGFMMLVLKTLYFNLLESYNLSAINNKETITILNDELDLLYNKPIQVLKNSKNNINNTADNYPTLTNEIQTNIIFDLRFNKLTESA